jgi:multicomponent K+:H+ antiporter subunit E
MTGLLRYPLLTLSLLIAWLLLAVSLSPGNILLGGVLALVLSGTFMVLALPKARLRRLGTVPPLLWAVLVEIVRSNNAVALIILRPGKSRKRSSGFVHIPLDMRSPYGLAALACILTATPGTVWVDYDTADGILLLHVLDLVDEDTWVRIVKDRWERRLMEIFE